MQFALPPVESRTHLGHDLRDRNAEPGSSLGNATGCRPRVNAARPSGFDAAASVRKLSRAFLSNSHVHMRGPCLPIEMKFAKCLRTCALHSVSYEG